MKSKKDIPITEAHDVNGSNTRMWASHLLPRQQQESHTTTAMDFSTSN